ncbi:MAG: biosynthetic arginine decarboxylase [Clostridia bacterium]|nr:biosynthetic arginine decarboxylase [Clostridia bacterium]MBN2882947.1 biosynthetic arginine decarboxylase [Clostridia bacterium]
MNKNEVLGRWTIEKSENLYNIKNWGGEYFSISDKGEVMVTASNGKPLADVSLMDIISEVKDRGLDMPVLLRFENILDSRISTLNKSFLKAMKDLEYTGTYRGVYPVKVNQQQQVLEETTKFGKRYHHGLEVGSKAELIAALSQMDDRESLLICNGYKDEEFINLGLNAVKLGFKCFFVIEMPGELSTILECARELNVKPNIGVRIKLASRAGGHWTESGGDRSIFGLNMSQVIGIVDALREQNMLDCLKLLHYHLGSQVPNIRDIRSAVGEASRVYAELVKEGAAMGYLDLGGGLAVDYDGSKTNFASSRNYSIDEYCTDIVEAVMNAMDNSEIEHPVIVTESGRAIVAYYSVLLFNVLHVSNFEVNNIPESIPDDSPESTASLFWASTNLTVKNIQESYNDALYYRDQARQVFNQGHMTLRERALAENIFWNIISRITRLKKNMKFLPPELENIESAIADIYYCNLSIFQSLPDSWAIDQLFPIMPVHRLNEIPSRNAVLADITCDCDGKIDSFIDLHDVSRTLPLHKIKNDEEYIIGAFLVGAYQETLGDLHNLFGDTNVVSIRINEEGFEIVREIHGDSVEDVLSYVEYDPGKMRIAFNRLVSESEKNKLITEDEKFEIVAAYENGLAGYTYYEHQ